MTPWMIYAVSVLYFAQTIQLWLNRQWAPGFLTLTYALAGIPLILMVQK